MEPPGCAFAPRKAATSDPQKQHVFPWVKEYHLGYKFPKPPLPNALPCPHCVLPATSAAPHRTTTSSSLPCGKLQGKAPKVQMVQTGTQELQTIYFSLVDNTLANLFFLLIDVHIRPKDCLLLSTQNATPFPKTIRNAGIPLSMESLFFPSNAIFHYCHGLKLNC